MMIFNFILNRKAQ